MPWHDEVLASGQRQALEELATMFTEVDAVLAGGLALSWRFGHRRSRDADWFTTRAFDSLEVASALQGQGATLTQVEPGTVHGDWRGLPFSLIRYRYPLRRDPDGPVPITDLRTACAMKMLAVVNRGLKRDLVDIAHILGQGYPLAMILSWVSEDIPALPTETMLRCLLYHAEAMAEPDPLGLATGAWDAGRVLIQRQVAAFIRQA
jgi:hypothetical protein